MDWASLVPAALTGSLFGTIASLFAPWANWSIRKRELRHASRKELIAVIRGLAGEECDRLKFCRSAPYLQIRPYLKQSTISIVEVKDPSIKVVFTGREYLVDPFWEDVVSDISELERKWSLC